MPDLVTTTDLTGWDCCTKDNAELITLLFDDLCMAHGGKNGGDSTLREGIRVTILEVFLTVINLGSTKTQNVHTHANTKNFYKNLNNFEVDFVNFRCKKEAEKVLLSIKRSSM